MDHKQGTDRNQMFMFCLESAIASDSFVRKAGTRGTNQHGGNVSAQRMEPY
jgi:hypothetical protein